MLLKRALESVIRQKNIEVEIIVINDCSEDNIRIFLMNTKKKIVGSYSFQIKKTWAMHIPGILH